MWGRKTSWKPSARRIDGGSGPRRGNMRPGCRHGLRTPARKANKLGFLARTPGLKFRKGGPAAGAVCVRLPAKPINSVFVRKPSGLKFRKGGPGAGAVCVRLPAKPIASVFVRKPGGRVKQKRRPGRWRANGKACIVKQLLDDAGFFPDSSFSLPIIAHLASCPRFDSRTGTPSPV